MTRHLTALGLAALGLGALTSHASAQTQTTPSKFYAAANYVLLDTDVQGDIESLAVGGNIQFDAIGARAGYRASDKISIEFEANVGTSDKNIDDEVEVLGKSAYYSGNIDVNYMAGIFVVYNQPLTENKRLNLVGRVGFMAGELEATGDVSTEILGVPTTFQATYTENKSGPVFGGGLSYDLTDHLFVRADATYIGLEDFPTMSYAASLGVRF